MKTENTRARELKALLKAMDETHVTAGSVITYEDDEELSEEEKTVRVVSSYRYLFGKAWIRKLMRQHSRHS